VHKKKKKGCKCNIGCTENRRKYHTATKSGSLDRKWNMGNTQRNRNIFRMDF